MPRFLNAVLLSATLLAPIAIVPTALRAQDHRIVYHDKRHNDDHEWNAHEDLAYRIWVRDNHRKYNDFARIRVRDQQAYWGWRHAHPDALLNIEVR